MTYKTIKYLSTVIVCAIAVSAGVLLWNYYMQSPWTRDGKVRAELVNITPEISGRITQVMVQDNQFVKAGSLLFEIDTTPFQLTLNNVTAVLTKAKINMETAEHQSARRHQLSKNAISSEDLDQSDLTVNAMKAAYHAAQADFDQAQWRLSKTRIYAPIDGYITNLQTRVGNYATIGSPLVALLDAHSFYVMGYFEETKLSHIKTGKKAHITLYNNHATLQGEVESIGRAIYDQSTDNNDLLINVKPNVPWVRLAQRVPVRIKLLDVPDDLTLVAGTTCSISIEQ